MGYCHAGQRGHILSFMQSTIKQRTTRGSKVTIKVKNAPAANKAKVEHFEEIKTERFFLGGGRGGGKHLCHFFGGKHSRTNESGS